VFCAAFVFSVKYHLMGRNRNHNEFPISCFSFRDDDDRLLLLQSNARLISHKHWLLYDMANAPTLWERNAIKRGTGRNS